jgi:predicted amidohydrolase
MPRYFFDVEDGHRLSDADDSAAIIKAMVLAVGVSLDTPEDDPGRQIAIINDQGRKIGNVPVYSRPSYKNPAR